MDDGSWITALLWPKVVAPTLNASPQERTDREVLALLVAGRLRDADSTWRHMGVSDGLAGVVTGQLLEIHPVSTTLLRWIEEAGRQQSSTTDALAELVVADEDPSRSAACAILASVALATDERLPEATASVRRALDGASGLAQTALLTQLSCRLCEVGDRNAAIVVVDELLRTPPVEHELDGELRVVARYNRYNASRGDRPVGELAELQRLGSGDASAGRGHSIASGLTHLVDDIAKLMLAAAARPGTRIWNWDDGWQQLLGAWLHAETWGEWSAARASRRLLGLYPVVAARLPFPPGWTHTSADVVDLDLIRRSGDDRTCSAVAGQWWDAGPLDDLIAQVRRVAQRPWLPPTEQANLGLLSAAGDLLDEPAADALLPRLVEIVDDRDASRTFAPMYYVAPAITEVLQAAGPPGHAAVAEAFLRWGAVPSNAQPLSAVTRAVRWDGLDVRTRSALRQLATSLLMADDAASRQLGVEVALAGGVTNVEDALIRAWRETRSLVVAAGLVRAAGADAVGSDLVGPLLDKAKAPNAAEGWVDARQLLALLADDPRAAAELRTWLLDPDVKLDAMGAVLTQLAVKGSLARKVIDSEVADALERASAASRDEEDWLGSSARLVAAVVSTRARSGQLGHDEATAWLVTMTAGSRYDRWAAAHALGPLSAVLQTTEAGLFTVLMLADRDVEIAGEAARQVVEVLDAHGAAQALREPVLDRLRQLGRRPGCLGPMIAGGVLNHLGALAAPEAERLRLHPSARVRAVLTH